MPHQTFEDAILDKIELEERLAALNPEIQTIFYDAYGEHLENIPLAFSHPNLQTEFLLERLSNLSSIKLQKVMLMRLGITTGTPMTLEEVANEFGTTRERIRQIESKFFKRRRPLTRRKRLKDFLSLDD